MTFESESVELSISELADLLQTTKSALRFYEKEGLIKPKRSSSSGYRRYSFQSIIELSDVVLYRELGIPVKDIRSLLDSPVEVTSHKLDETEGELLEQMRETLQKLENIAARRRRVRTYQTARFASPRIVERPRAERLYRFPIESADAMRAYLRGPDQVRYAVLFPDASDSLTFVDCALSPVEGLDNEIVWQAPTTDGRWLECLMRTDYSLTGSNDLRTYVDYLRERNLTAGMVIGEYLTFDWDENQDKRFDYYRIWIEVLDG